MKQYSVDAFTDTLFHGNPAAVVVLDYWPNDDLLQSIAIENNLSETAFTVKNSEAYQLRWFTPGGEIDLCGHATLATSFVLANFYEPEATTFTFTTLSGTLTVQKVGELFELDFPSYELKPVEISQQMIEVLGFTPKEAWIGRDLVVVANDSATITNFTANDEKIATLGGLMLHITAQGTEQFDCISRSFGPKIAISEDPVCGSGHCHIIPYWSKKLNQEKLVAYQASKRGGTLFAHYKGARISLSGHAVLYATTELALGALNDVD